MAVAAARTKRKIEPVADATRSRLLEAAVQVFAEVGYRRATVREICARAEVNVALVNYHFGDKLELYSEVLQSLVSVGRLEAMREALNQKGPPQDILRNAIKARLRGLASGDREGLLVRIMAHEVAQPTPAMTRIINRVSRPLYKQMCEMIGALLGLPGDHEKTRLCAHSIMGQVAFYVLAGPVLRRLWPELIMSPEQLDRIGDHIADFSLPYLKQRTRTRK